jgi:hypothetical protein
MSKTIKIEDPITLADVPDLLPAIGGKKVSVYTVGRWASIGVRGVRLEVHRIGGRVLTSRQAVERFLAAINAE